MLRKDKGIEYLIEAVSHVPNADFKVMIAGSAFEWTEDEVAHLIDKYSVADKIILRIGYVPDEEMAAYYGASDVVLFPYSSQYTGGCGPLIKGASAHGKPVIVTNVSDIGRMVKVHENGFVADYLEPTSLAECMRHFIQLSPESKQKLVEKSKELATLHSWKSVAKKLSELLGRCHEYNT